MRQKQNLPSEVLQQYKPRFQVAHPVQALFLFQDHLWYNHGYCQTFSQHSVPPRTRKNINGHLHKTRKKDIIITYCSNCRKLLRLQNHTFDCGGFCLLTVSVQTFLSAELAFLTFSLVPISSVTGDSGMMVGSVAALSDFSTTSSVVASTNAQQNHENNET